MQPANYSDQTSRHSAHTTLRRYALLTAATVLWTASAQSAPRPASDDQYRRATGTAPAQATPAAVRQTLQPQSYTASNSAIAASILSALPNQDKLAEYVRAAVRSAPANTTAVVSEAVSAAPEYAETVVHAAIQTRPEQAEAITAAALSIAPRQADRVIYAAIAAQPTSAAASVRGALAAAPEMQAQIGDAARLAAAKYQLNDPALNQALAANYGAAPQEPAEQADLYYEEADREAYTTAKTTLLTHRATLLPRLHSQSGLPMPAGHSRER